MSTTGAGHVERAADGTADRGDLLKLTERLRSRQHVFRPCVAVPEQRANCDGCNIALIDWSCWSRQVRPAHDVAGANLWSPPRQRIGGEHSGPKESPFDAGLLNQPLDFFVEDRTRIRKRGL